MNPNELKLRRKAGGLFRLDFSPQFGEFLSSEQWSRIQFAAIGVHSRFNCMDPAEGWGRGQRETTSAEANERTLIARKMNFRLGVE
jgi:hypothetical protein